MSATMLGSLPRSSKSITVPLPRRSNPSKSFVHGPIPLIQGGFSRVLIASLSRKPSAFSSWFCSKATGDVGEIGVANSEECLVDNNGHEKSNGEGRAKFFSSKEEPVNMPLMVSTTLGYLLMQNKNLRRYGVAGVLSYGLLNTVYYLTTFLLVWFYFAPAPGRMGYAAAVARFLKVMAMVWAGSQVTKIIRAGGALALAPFVDRGLSWFTIKFNFESEGKAFAAIVGLCLGLALLLFFGLTLLWA